MSGFGRDNNVILIGMPGSGKSTVGVLLAKALCVDYADTDLLLQRSRMRPLKNIIDAVGPEGFLELEADLICSLTLRDHVIATGGSVVCRERSVRHLKSSGVLVWIDAPLEDLERRIGGMKGIRARGVAIGRGMTLKDLFDQRLPLYEKAADIRVECGGLDAERCCAKIIQELERYGTGR